MSENKRLLWLVSWYPNLNDSFDGDFIQRHAQVAAWHHHVHVIYVGMAEIDRGVERHFSENKNLREEMIYFRKPLGPLSKLRKQMIWSALMKKAIARYIEVEGKPHAIHVHIPWKAGWIGRWASKKWKLPLLISEQWGMYDPRDPQYLGAEPIWKKTMLTRIYSSAHRVSAVSHYLAAGIQRETGKQVTHVIPNVVNTATFYEQNEKEERFTLMHVSNMVPLKNVDGIIAAFAKWLKEGSCPDAHLVLIGNRNSDYAGLCNELGLNEKQVDQRGEVPHTEVASMMRQAHAFIIFSDAETFSCVTAEALCCGLPVIASRVGALPELVDSRSGWLVERRNREQLADAMEQAFRSYKEGRKVGDPENAAARYGEAAVATAFQAFYKGVSTPV